MTLPEIIIWPLPEFRSPRVVVRPESVLRGAAIVEIGQAKFVALPDDFYTRELFEHSQLGTESALEFTKQWGYLALPYDQFEYEPLLHNFLRRRPKVDPSELNVEFVNDAIFLLMGISNTLVWYSRREEHEMKSEWERLMFPADDDTKTILQTISKILTIGLQPLSPKAYVSESINETPDDDNELVSLFSAICLQMAQDIDRHAEFRRCANESCRTWFSKQRGRAQFGQNRTEGVKYCSTNCAQAQAQRDYRKRMKEKTNG